MVSELENFLNVNKSAIRARDTHLFKSSLRDINLNRFLEELGDEETIWDHFDSMMRVSLPEEVLLNPQVDASNNIQDGMTKMVQEISKINIEDMSIPSLVSSISDTDSFKNIMKSIEENPDDAIKVLSGMLKGVPRNALSS